MAIWKLNSCHRCGGDLFLERDDKWYEHCLQCGNTYELKSLPEFCKGEGYLIRKGDETDRN